MSVIGTSISYPDGATLVLPSGSIPFVILPGSSAVELLYPDKRHNVAYTDESMQVASNIDPVASWFQNATNAGALQIAEHAAGCYSPPRQPLGEIGNGGALRRAREPLHDDDSVDDEPSSPRFPRRLF